MATKLKSETYKGKKIEFTKYPNGYIIGSTTGINVGAFKNKKDTFDAIKNSIDGIKKELKTIRVAFYKWGSFYEMIDIEISELKEMQLLDGDQVMGFDVRSEDEEKFFYAEENDIEESEDEGTGVKRSFATKLSIF